MKNHVHIRTETFFFYRLFLFCNLHDNVSIAASVHLLKCSCACSNIGMANCMTFEALKPRNGTTKKVVLHIQVRQAKGFAWSITFSFIKALFRFPVDKILVTLVYPRTAFIMDRTNLRLNLPALSPHTRESQAPIHGYSLSGRQNRCPAWTA